MSRVLRKDPPPSYKKKELIKQASKVSKNIKSMGDEAKSGTEGGASIDVTKDPKSTVPSTVSTVDIDEQFSALEAEEANLVK